MLLQRDRYLRAWTSFFQRSLQTPLSFKKFEIAARGQATQFPLDGAGIFQAWAATGKGLPFLSARYIRYLDLLLDYHTLTDASVLKGIAKGLVHTLSLQYVAANQADDQGEPMGRPVEATALERLTYRMLHVAPSNGHIDDRFPELRTSTSIAELLAILVQTLDGQTMLTDPAWSIVTELAANGGPPKRMLYLSSLSMNLKLTLPDVGAWFDRYLPSFCDILSIADRGLAESIIPLLRQSRLYDGKEESVENLSAADMSSLEFMSQTVDTLSVNTRAALYIYFNAMLTGRPSVDDATLFGYLNTRYRIPMKSEMAMFQGEPSVLIADLITASFDVLSNAINRTETTESIHIARSFLTNKLPVLLENYSGMFFSPETVETYITDAVNRMDPSADPYSTQSFDLLSGSGILSEARQEFLFACALHGLIPEQSIESILGDVPMQSLPEAGKYNRAELVTQCRANSSRIDELIGEMENMDGNSGEIVAAVLEIVQSLVFAKDSITLKGVCNALTRRPQTLDVIMLFADPTTFLRPLCEMLDQWQDPEDQGEQHPVYEEFGSILLLVLVLRHRFSLQDDELGVEDPDSFVLRHAKSGWISRSPSSMTEPERRCLGGWIKGLFESEGISDELMLACSPKDFYMLVASLFDQSLKACQVGILAIDTIKGGFEFILEPFLLPSLITGLGWFTRRLWETKSHAPELDFLLPVLKMLIKPPSLPSESTPLHTTVLSVTARSLERSLAHVQKLHPRRQDIDSLVSILKPYLQAPCTGHTQHSELEGWCATTGGGIFAAVRHVLRSLLMWSDDNAMNSPPPAYTHRLILTSVSMVGAPTVLSALIEDAVKLATSGNSAEVLLDILSAIILSPSANKRIRIALLHALECASNDAYELARSDGARAEFIVKLFKRVKLLSRRPVEDDPETAIDSRAQDVTMEMQGIGDQSIVNTEETEIKLENMDMDGLLQEMQGVSTDRDYADHIFAGL